MFNTKEIEKLVDSTFKPDEFYKNFAKWQLSFIESYQAASKSLEENNKFAKNYFESQTKAFNLNTIFEKAEEVRKTNEENFNKVKSYFEQSSKNFNTDDMLSQFKNLSKVTEENTSQVLKMIEQHTKSLNSTTLIEQAGKLNQLAEENQKKLVSYFNGQYELLKKFQEDLSKGMKSTNNFGEISEAFQNYSKGVANTNLKHFNESFEHLRKTVSK